MGADGGVACIKVGNTVTFVVAADGKRWHLGGVVIDVVLDRYVVAVPGDIIKQSGLDLKWPAFGVGKRSMTMSFIQVCKTQADIKKFCELLRHPPVSLVWKAYQLSQTEPVKLMPEAVLHAETPPRYRYFHVDVVKKSNTTLVGLVLRFTAMKEAFVVQVTEGSCMSDWNARCSRTFPEDQLQSNDQVVQVNKVVDTGEFEKVMMRDARIFMIVRRRLITTD